MNCILSSTNMSTIVRFQVTFIFNYFWRMTMFLSYLIDDMFRNGALVHYLIWSYKCKWPQNQNCPDTLFKGNDLLPKYCPSKQSMKSWWGDERIESKTRKASILSSPGSDQNSNILTKIDALLIKSFFSPPSKIIQPPTTRNFRVKSLNIKKCQLKANKAPPTNKKKILK